MGVRIGGVAAALVVFLGSFLPWISVSAYGESATFGGTNDGLGEEPLTLLGAGWTALVLAIAIGVLFGIWKRATIIAGAAVSVLVLLFGIYAIINISTAFEDSGISPDPGFGLYLVVLGGLGGVMVGLIALLYKPTGAGAAAAPYGAGQAPAWGQTPGQYGAPAPTQQLPYGAPAQAAQYAPPAQQAPYGAPAQPAPAQYAPAQQAPAQPQAASAPAGWLPDPQGQARLRYWDGIRWTEHTQN